MKIRPGMEEKYQKGYNNNLSPYGHAVYTFAERWAEYGADPAEVRATADCGGDD